MPGPKTQAPPWGVFGPLGPAWVEVDLDAIAWNVAQVRAAAAPARLCAVVKADAYGHGAVETARAVLAAGADCLGVSTLAEAVELRAAGIAEPVLIFTPLFPSDAEFVAGAGLTPTIVSLDAAQALSRAVAQQVRTHPLPVHLKVDTGMGRYGVSPGELPELLQRVAELPGLRVEGVFTHFARPGEPARTQLRTFLAATEAAAAQAGVTIPIRHAAASTGLMSVPEAALDMVRVGNLLYGMRPLAGGRSLDLRPAWRLRVAVAQVRRLPPGSRVGYGSEFTARRETLTATLPVGFADGVGVVPGTRLERIGPLLRALGRAVLRGLGIDRALGAAAGSIEFDGRVAPVLGRMSMQQTTVDVTAVPGVAAGAVATVHCRPSAASSRLSRVYLRDGAPWRARTPAGTFDFDELRQAAPAQG